MKVEQVSPCPTITPFGALSPRQLVRVLRNPKTSLERMLKHPCSGSICDETVSSPAGMRGITANIRKKGDFYGKTKERNAAKQRQEIYHPTD